MNGTTSKNIAPYIVAAVVSAFLIVIAYMMFFVPKMDESKKLVANAATAHASNAALTAKADKLEAIANNLDPLKEQVGRFSQSFPSAAQQQEMIDAINEAAASSGVTLTTLNPNAPKPAEGADGAEAAAPVGQIRQEGSELPGPAPVAAATEDQAAATSTQLGTVTLKIDGDGSLEAVQAFVTKIENLKRPLLVHEVQIEKLENRYHVMLNGETFLAAPLVEPKDESVEASGDAGDFPDAAVESK